MEWGRKAQKIKQHCSNNIYTNWIKDQMTHKLSLLLFCMQLIFFDWFNPLKTNKYCMLYLHGSTAMFKPSVKHIASKLIQWMLQTSYIATIGQLIMYYFILQSNGETPRFMLCQYHQNGRHVHIQIIYTFF